MVFGSISFGLGVYIAVTDELLAGLLLLFLGPLIVLDCRAEVVVDPHQGTISSQRTIRRWTGRISDIESVYVPSRGPIVLRLQPGVDHSGGGFWPGQVVTGIHSDRRGDDGRAVHLADALGGLDVVAASRYNRRGYDFSADHRRHVELELFRSGRGILLWIVTAVVLSVLAVLLIASVAGS